MALTSRENSENGSLLVNIKMMMKIKLMRMGVMRKVPMTMVMKQMRQLMRKWNNYLQVSVMLTRMSFGPFHAAISVVADASDGGSSNESETVKYE